IAGVEARLGEEALAEVAGQGVAETDVAVRLHAHIRYVGTDTTLPVYAGELMSVQSNPSMTSTVRLASAKEMKSRFATDPKARFGFIDCAKALVVEAVSIEAISGGAKFQEPRHAISAEPLSAPARRTEFFSGGAWHEAQVFTRDQLRPGHG